MSYADEIGGNNSGFYLCKHSEDSCGVYRKYMFNKNEKPKIPYCLINPKIPHCLINHKILHCLINPKTQ